MKQKILSILLMILLLVTPVVAEDRYYTVELNGISYLTSSPLITKDNNLYMSLDDFSKILMISVTNTHSTYNFTANNQKVELRAGSNTYTINSQKRTFKAPPFVNDKQLYIPVHLFSELGYPCNIDSTNQCLSVSTLLPYSRNGDEPSNHTFKATKNNLENIPVHVTQFSTQSDFEHTLQKALTDHLYISFLDNSSFEDVYKTFGQKFDYSPYNNISITFREVDTSVFPNVIKDTITLPVTVKMTPSSFQITIAEEKFEYKNLWATFYAPLSLTDVDLNKTADATLMRAFYTYYRDRYDLRDDTSFSPYMTITSERTNSLEHAAYSLSDDEQQSDYMVKLYRVHPSGSMNYLIELEPLSQ